jgi:hypothetical protein
VEDCPEQVGQTMQATIETTSTQHSGHVASFVQEEIGFGLIATEVKGCYDGNRHHFRIAHLTLSIFGMVKCFQKIVTKAENCYNLAVHVVLLAQLWFQQLQLYQEPHGFSFFYPR